MPLPSRGRRDRRSPATASPANRGFVGRWTRRLLVGAVLAAILYHGLPRLLPIPPALLQPPTPGTEITDRSGRPLRRLLSGDQRVQSLSFEAIPRDLVDATVSAEDKRFWAHGGIDAIGLVRASLDSLIAGRRVSGASTITQQLVKVADERYANRTWKDKIREMAYARKLEITWSKEKILTEYLQRVQYGNQATGCASASSLYFQKPLADLSLAECAFLAGLPQAPTRLNPYRNFEGAKRRQEWILSRMQEDGRVTADQVTQATNERLRLRRWTGGFEAPHFVEMLLASLRPPPSEPDPPDGLQPVARVQTTLDLDLQRFCESEVRRQLHTLQSQQARDAAVVVLDNLTGGLRALVGSPDFFRPRAGQVNGALTPRSAGSTLKPFTYLLALEQGDSPATIVDDLPKEFMTGSGLYTPHNYDRRHYGPMSYREALANSLNVAAVRVLERIGGPEVLHQSLLDVGLTTLSEAPDHYGLGLTIGNAEVRLLDLVNAYAGLARLGQWRPVVLRTEDESPAAGAPTGPPPAFTPENCWLIADILNDDQARSRCFGLDSPLRLAFPAAVKTGTSTDFRDNWCIGFTAEFTVGVWMGNFDHRPMDRVSGVTGAAPLWHTIMNWLATHHGATWLPRPNGIVEVEVDPLTGEQIPPEIGPRSRPLATLCSRAAIPPVAHPDRYDAMGRVVLGQEYARWLRGPDNWLPSTAAAVGSSSAFHAQSILRITSPPPGATIILDPDLPNGGQRLPLRANAPLRDAQWSSKSLQLELRETGAVAWLIPGHHEIELHDPDTGAHTRTTITVRSL